MIENFTQLDANKQHLTETFGEKDMSICSWLQHPSHLNFCSNPNNKTKLDDRHLGDCCLKDCPLSQADKEVVFGKSKQESVSLDTEKLKTEQTSIEETLAQRGNTYGDFPTHALITQNIKRAMANSNNWTKLTDDKKECLEMVAHKIGRILNGDPGYKDSWHDIIGYVKLVDDTLID